MAPVCFQMVGLPGSGKSTLRGELMWDFRLKEARTVIVSMDDYIHSVRAGRTYAEAFSDHAEDAAAHVAERMGYARAHGLPTIIDMTNLTASHRRRNAEALPEHRHIAVVPLVPRAVRLERLAARTEQAIPDHVLEAMERKFQLPSTKNEAWLSDVRYYGDLI